MRVFSTRSIRSFLPALLIAIAPLLVSSSRSAANGDDSPKLRKFSLLATSNTRGLVAPCG